MFTFLKIHFLMIVLQIPQGVPNPANSEPLSLKTPFDYILYIGLPILILIGGFFLWRRKTKREDDNDK